MRYMLTDDLWAAMGSLVRQAKRHRGGHPPTVPDRVFFEALLYVSRTGIPWRDLPAGFGAWDAAYNRSRRWAASGGLRRLFEGMTADPRFGEVRRVFIDGTIVRAHPHAAGELLLQVFHRRRGTAPSSGPTRTRPGRPAAKKVGPGRSAAAQGPGRSRGGLTTKIVVTAAAEDAALAVDVVPGQAHEAPHLPRMVDATAERVGVIDEVVGDRAYDADALRAGLLDRGVMPQVPGRKNRTDPWPLYEPAHRERNRVERLFAKLKGFRRVATRYDKLRAPYLGFVHLALGFIRLRRSTNVNRP